MMSKFLFLFLFLSGCAWHREASYDCHKMCLKEGYPNYKTVYRVSELDCYCTNADKAILFKVFRAEEY